MQKKTDSTTRRDFLKKAGKGIAATTLAGLSPMLSPIKKAFAGVPTINFAYILSDHHAPMMVIAKNFELCQN